MCIEMDGFHQKVTRLAAKLMQQLIEMSSRQIDGKLSAQHQKILLQNKLIKIVIAISSKCPFSRTILRDKESPHNKNKKAEKASFLKIETYLALEI